MPASRRARATTAMPLPRRAAIRPALPRAQFPRHEAQVRFDLMRSVEALGIVEGGHEGGSRHRPDVGHALQPSHPLVGLGERGDSFMGVRQLLIHLAHDGQQGRHLGQQLPGQGQRRHAPAEPLGRPRRHPPAALPQERADQGNVPCPRPNQRVPDRQPSPDVPLPV